MLYTMQRDGWRVSSSRKRMMVGGGWRVTDGWRVSKNEG